MKRPIIFIAAITGAALTLAACSTGPGESGPQPEGFADYETDPRLGERVDRICFGSRINGFGETTDETVLLEAGVNDWYLAHTFTCPQLDYAQSLSFDRFGSCLRQGDDIIPYDSIAGDNRNDVGPRSCRIRAIYGWDPDAATAAGEADQSR